MAEKRTILVCSCEDTMPLDADALQRGCRGAEIKQAHQLCHAELERFRAAAKSAPLTIACTQEAPLFSEVAGDAVITFANIRETAGWSADAKKAGPKMAALLAAAAEPMPPVPYVALSSEGVALIYGRDERAIEAAELLKDHLDITVLITRPSSLSPPRVVSFPVVKGTIRSAKGHLGAFELLIDELPDQMATFFDRDISLFNNFLEVLFSFFARVRNRADAAFNRILDKIDDLFSAALNNIS